MGNILYPQFKIANPVMRESGFNIVSAKMDVEPLEWKSQAATPIKTMEDINMVSKYLVDNGRLRDNLMFLAGINFGLRCSDLTQLRFGHLIRPDGSVRDELWIREIKTARKRGAKDKTVLQNGEVQYKLKAPRHIPVPEAVKQALRLYCAGQEIDLNNFLFTAKNSDKPLCYDAVYDVFMKLLDWNRVTKKPGTLSGKLTRPVHASTHFMRKTFAYHYIMSSPERNRAVEMLQRAFGHSNQLITLSYAGITDDEIQEVILKMNLGGDFMNTYYGDMVTEENVSESEIINLEVSAKDRDETA